MSKTVISMNDTKNSVYDDDEEQERMIRHLLFQLIDEKRKRIYEGKEENFICLHTFLRMN